MFDAHYADRIQLHLHVLLHAFEIHASIIISKMICGNEMSNMSELIFNHHSD